MPALSWNEIRQNAIRFSREWSGETEERAEAQTFWNEFFAVFGMKRRQVASFEERVQSVKGKHRIDLFWKGKLLAEHKSRGQDLGKATSQAFNYIQELINEGRQDECPRYVAISDFERMVLYDLEPDEQLELQRASFTDGIETVEFPIKDFHRHIKHFAFIAGLKTQRLREQDPANLKATKLMANLHDELEKGGYEKPELERLLVRILFCLFADDTGVFDADSFTLFIENRTREDGYDLGMQLQRLFEVLDTPEEKRGHIRDEELLAFPYINGELFTERLHFAEFTPAMREALLNACDFQWDRISPAIFGSLFQGVMDDKERRKIGAHYTSERDILKLIGPLFLDGLRAEFEQIAADRSSRRKSRLEAFQQKLGSLKLLDPACGCGNFLVIAYRELRRLELEALKLLHNAEEVQQLNAIDLQLLSQVDVDQFYGIEIEIWPSRIAETALWLTDHQMNRELSEAFGQIFLRIPLKKSPHIHHANALRIDWNDVLPANECSYVLGNPPFVGGKYQSPQQKDDVKAVAGDIKGFGLLDFVTMWYLKAADYIQDTRTECAFVSTNSICQGEQVGILWPELFQNGVKINFAHRTFSWQSEASGAAHVHVVIIGFALYDKERKIIYEYNDIKGEPEAIPAAHINPYLVDATPLAIANRNRALCAVPELVFGSMPNDGGHLLLETEEKAVVLQHEPELSAYIRPILGSREFINNQERWCIWLLDASPSLISNSDELKNRIARVKSHREASNRQTTRLLARTPSLFGERRQPTTPYLLIPSVSSERRPYIPIGFLPPEVIASNLCLTVSDATPYHFGILSSAMHMAWVRQVCGRLKSDFRYSAKLVYNNYPWPVEATDAQKERIAEAAQGVLDARQKYLDAGSTLADLYDPLAMPADLLKAHQELDRTVDKAYRGTKFESERERVEFLFALYEKLTTPLTAEPKKKRTRKQKA